MFSMISRDRDGGLVPEVSSGHSTPSEQAHCGVVQKVGVPPATKATAFIFKLVSFMVFVLRPAPRASSNKPCYIGY
jgi:hypothetical protein